MILIHKDTDNTIAVTLREKATISNPTYLFEFTNDLTRSSKYFIGVDATTYPNRVNMFTITETNWSGDEASGIVELLPVGFWSYRVFEQASTTNLDVRLTGALVESGKVKVVGSTTNKQVYDNQPKQYVTYGN